MAEMLVDLIAYDAAKQALAEGSEELNPAAVVDRLLDGDNPIRIWREFRGLSSAQLATACGVSAAAISQLETGKRQPSVALLKKLAVALSVELEQLTSGGAETPSATVHDPAETYRQQP